MTRRWKEVSADNGGTSYEESSTLNFRAHEQGISLDGSHTTSKPRLKTHEDIGNGLQARALREAKYLENLYEEWIQGDPNHTAALLLLGLTLLSVAYWHHISYWLVGFIQPSWGTFCGLAAFICIVSAVYPWIIPVQNHWDAHKSVVKARMEGLASQMGRMTIMPEQMATMIKQLDVMINELVAQRQNLESMKDKTDWLPPKHKDGSMSEGKRDHGPPRPAGGILNKLF